MVMVQEFVGDLDTNPIIILANIMLKLIHIIILLQETVKHFISAEH